MIGHRIIALAVLGLLAIGSAASSTTGSPALTVMWSGNPISTGWTPTAAEEAEDNFPGTAPGSPGGGHVDFSNHPYGGLKKKEHRPIPKPICDVLCPLTQGTLETCPATESGENSACTLVLLHGYNDHNYGGDWPLIKAYMEGKGFTNVERLAYYGGECANDADATDSGKGGASDGSSHSHWFAYDGTHFAGSNDCGAPDAAFHTIDTDYRHIANHVAWNIYHRYSKHLKVVDVVAHSMGGVVIRYAMAQSTGKDLEWPPSLLINQVVTLGSPHDGAVWYTAAAPSLQSDQLQPDSGENNWLWTFAQAPRGGANADWTMLGSECDFVVNPYGSATDMVGHHRVVYLWPSMGSTPEPPTCPSHTGVGSPHYIAQIGEANDAVAWYQDPPDPMWYGFAEGPPCDCFVAPRALHWASEALYYRDW